MPDEDFGRGVAKLASGERLDGDAFLSWSCCDIAKSRERIICRGRKRLHASAVRYPAEVVTADAAVVIRVLAAVVECCFC